MLFFPFLFYFMFFTLKCKGIIVLIARGWLVFCVFEWFGMVFFLWLDKIELTPEGLSNGQGNVEMLSDFFHINVIIFVDVV